MALFTTRNISHDKVCGELERMETIDHEVIAKATALTHASGVQG